MPNLELNFEEEFTLFGLRSNYKDYTLAYYINKKLNINLCRESKDLSMIYMNQKIFFSLFNFYDEKNDNMWSIIKNKAEIINNNDNINNLFRNDLMTSYKYLIDEHKEFDYLIKISGLIFNKKEIKYLINRIHNIEIMTEISDIKKLSMQSKENLCF